MSEQETSGWGCGFFFFFFFTVDWHNTNVVEFYHCFKMYLNSARKSTLSSTLWLNLPGFGQVLDGMSCGKTNTLNVI